MERLLKEVTSKLSPENEENLIGMVCSANPEYYPVEVSLNVRGEGREIGSERYAGAQTWRDFCAIISMCVDSQKV